MILAELHDLLDRVPGGPWTVDDAGLLHDLAPSDPTEAADPDCRAALLAAHAYATADAGLPAVIAGVRREHLVRWDGWTTTWHGHAPEGRPVALRVLRPHALRDPVLRRRLRDDLQALGPSATTGALYVDGLLDEDPVGSDPGPSGCGAVAVELGGPSFPPLAHGGHVEPAALARLVAGTLSTLAEREARGVGLPALDDAEVRDMGDHVALVCLTPTPPQDAGPVLADLAQRWLGWWQAHDDHPIADLLEGLAQAPPTRFADAAQRCVAALAEALASRRHALMQAAARQRDTSRRDRFVEAVARLEATLGPPEGMAALGVDLEGRTRIVRSDGERITWGTQGEADEVLLDADGFDVPAARRLVRARGSAPVSPALNREVGGDLDFAEQIARWVAAALELRTIRLLLDASGN